MKTNIVALVAAILLYLGCGSDAVDSAVGISADIVDNSTDAAGDAQIGPDLVADTAPENCHQGNISIQCKGDSDCLFPGPCQIGGACVWQTDGPLCVKKCVYDDVCAEGDICLSGKTCCTPTNSCDNRECGDDGCGTSCGGECVGPQDACVDGLCVCQPNCADKSCGSDGCGGVCGKCADDQVCMDDNTCCTTACEGKECGPDGCGGVCGECLFPNDICTAEQTCFCIPDCSGKHCGDDGCGGDCWKCPEDEVCVNGECIACTPQCDGKECGPNGCGGVCGKCLDNFTCDISGQCICIPDPCADKECGQDGCGGVCGECADDWVCMPDGWCCKPQCDNKECGPDGCGGECPSACSTPWQQCWNMTCIPKDEAWGACINGKDDDQDGAPDCLDDGCSGESLGGILICPSNDYDIEICWLNNFSGDGITCVYELDWPCTSLEIGCFADAIWIKANLTVTFEIDAPIGANTDDAVIHPARIYYPGPEDPTGAPTVSPVFLWDIPPGPSVWKLRWTPLSRQ